jgi:uncharacterized protein (DUF1697 family)
MALFLALLRGVNVGGKMLSMELLRGLAAEIGYTEVATYIQSGNLLLSSEHEPNGIVRDLESSILVNSGLQVSVIVRSEADMQAIAGANPFLAVSRDLDPRRLHVTFLASVPASDVTASASEGPDRFEFRGKEVYLHCPDGYGRSTLNNSYWERRLGVRATTRNWNSVMKLTEMLSA